MKTKTKLLLPLLFFAALLLVPALTLYGLVKSPSGWSVEENRALADVPEVSLQNMLDGTLVQNLETFYSDHIFARRQLLKLDTLLQMKLLRRPIVHDVVLGDTVLLPAPGFSMKLSGEAREAQAVSIAEGLQSVKSAADEVGAQLLYTLVPEQRTVYAAYYPDWMENPALETKKNREALLPALQEAGVPALDMTSAFSLRSSPLPYYSRVDHHYTLRGAYLTYESVCEAFGLRAGDLTVTDTQSELLGTYNRKLYGLGAIHEPMQVLQDAFPAYTREDNGKASDTPLIYTRASGQSLYTDYMGGDVGETIVTTNRPELPRILIVGDSFTNALEPLAVFDFDEMRSLDYRHFDGAALSEYIRAYKPDFVLILRDDVSCLNRSGNGALS